MDIAAGTLKWAPYLQLKVVAVEAFAKDKAELSAEVASARASRAELVIVAGHLKRRCMPSMPSSLRAGSPLLPFATVGPALPEWSALNGDPADLTFATSIWEPNDSSTLARICRWL